MGVRHISNYNVTIRLLILKDLLFNLISSYSLVISCRYIFSETKSELTR